MPPPLTKARFGACSLLLLTLWGCSTPPAARPPDTSALTGAYRQAAPTHSSEPSAHESVHEAHIWRAFGDPVLEDLVQRAHSANFDVRMAWQRVRQARAGSTQAASRGWPTVEASASGSIRRTGLPDEVKRGLPDTRAAQAGIDIAWELDFFGAASAGADAARLDALAAVAGAQAAQWLAATEVARQYFMWQGARLRLGQLQALLQAQQDTERLTRSRYAQGLASAFDLSRASAEVQALAAELPPLRSLVVVTGHQIDVLLGAAPGATTPDWRPRHPPRLPEVPPLASGQPIELLQRRPDLRVARHEWLAEAARLRESQADLWPQVFLAAAWGRQDLRLNALNLPPVGLRQVALAFTAPLFNAGRLRAALEEQSARERAATLRYERAVLQALVDVENSLVALAQERDRGLAWTGAVQSRSQGVRHAESLHRQGQIDLLQVLDAQRGLIAAELAHTDSRTQQALASVQLLQALGGGWHSASSPASPQPLN